MKYNNNPFNIRYTGQHWKGLSGHNNGFCEFESLDYGIRAWLLLMRTYRHKYSIECISDIVERFAPSSENDVNSYLKSIFVFISIDVHKRLQYDSDYYKLGYAMSKVETGFVLTSFEIERVAKYFDIHIVL